MRIAGRSPLAWLLDLLAPQRCVLCGTSGEPLCIDCRDRATALPQTRRASWAGAPTVIALGNYEGELRDAVLALKFRAHRAAGPILGAILARKLRCEIDFIVPVPLHPKRLCQRGYNQAEEIARGIALALAKPLKLRVLVRTRNTVTQSSLALVDRDLNVAHAFGPGPEAPQIAGRRILLVDDVVTTGATLRACALVLRAARVKSIVAAALALRM